MVTGVSLSFRTAAGLFTFLGEQRHRAVNGFEHTDYFLRGGFAFGIRRTIHGTLGTSANLRRGGATDFDLVSAETSVEWLAARSLRLRGRVTTWNWSEDGRQESLVGGGLGVDWSIGLFTLGARYDRLSWKDGFERSENRLSAQIVRKF